MSLAIGDFAVVGAAGLVEGDDGIDEGSELAGVDEGCDLHELALVGLDDEEGVLDSGIFGRLFIGGDGDGEASGLDEGKRAQEGVSADGVEDDVDGLGDGFFEAGGLIVDDFVGSELADEGGGGGGGGGDDVGPVQVGDLDGEVADGSRGTVDEDAVAGMEVAVFEEALPGGEGADGDGGGLEGSEGDGGGRDEGGLGEAELGERARGEPVVHAEDGLAEGEVVDVGAKGSDGSGELVGGNGCGAWSSRVVVRGGVPAELGGGDAGGRDADDDLPGTGLGIGKSGFDERRGVAGVRKAHDLHEYLQG